MHRNAAVFGVGVIAFLGASLTQVRSHAATGESVATVELSPAECAAFRGATPAKYCSTSGNGQGCLSGNTCDTSSLGGCTTMSRGKDCGVGCNGELDATCLTTNSGPQCNGTTAKACDTLTPDKGTCTTNGNACDCVAPANPRKTICGTKMKCI